jgi:hypothetical protein
VNFSRTAAADGSHDDERTAMSEQAPRHSLKFGKRRVPLPRSRALRITLGTILVIGGMFGFLPILGFWMIPVGVLILSVDVAAVRRFRRRTEVRWARWRAQRRAAQSRTN